MVLILAIDAIQVLAVATSFGSLLLLPILAFKERVDSAWAIYRDRVGDDPDKHAGRCAVPIR
jgi:hypothetical protein